jgi:prolipoprotein diacylglyceryltransferase
MVIGIYTLCYVTPLYILFFLIIFGEKELYTELNLKCYSIAYLIGFIIKYFNAVNLLKNDEKPINKGF